MSQESLPGGEHREDGVRTADHCSRLTDTNNHPGIQWATADLMWPVTGFAIGAVATIIFLKASDRRP